MAITGAAIQPAATSAATSSINPVDAVNTAVGYPAAQRYPGAVDASQYTEGQTSYQGSVAGPVTGSFAGEPFTESLPPAMAPGGGYMESSWMTGTDAPIVPWDSSAGEPFAPSGALNPDLHADDGGGVFFNQYVVGAAVSGLSRHTETGQTHNEIAPTQTTIGQDVPNGRTNLDQYQTWAPGHEGGYAPWNIPYSERPILNNLAWINAATQDGGNVYGVSGLLPNMAPYDYDAQAYEAPSDPAVSTVTSSQSASPSGIGGGWVL